MSDPACGLGKWGNGQLAESFPPFTRATLLYPTRWESSSFLAIINYSIRLVRMSPLSPVFSFYDAFLFFSLLLYALFYREFYYLWEFYQLSIFMVNISKFWNVLDDINNVWFNDNNVLTIIYLFSTLVYVIFNYVEKYWREILNGLNSPLESNFANDNWKTDVWITKRINYVI